MAKYYQDFVGLNVLVYEPNGWDALNSQTATFSNLQWPSAEVISYKGGQIKRVLQNHLGIFEMTSPYVPSEVATYRNVTFPLSTLKNGADYFNALMIKRNGPYGYPSWRQIRSSHNPLSRKQRANNIFTYVTEPGQSREVSLNGGQYSVTDRYGPINLFTEPVITDSSKPLELIGGMNIYNQNTDTYDIRNVKIKTSFDNEIEFFANEQINQYYETIETTDENYERFKELYLNGGLDDDSSPLETFALMTYRQTIWPKRQYAYLNKTRSRTYFVNKFWRDKRTDRTQTDISNGYGSTVPSQSMWPLDVAADWGTRGIPHEIASSPGRYFYYYIGARVGSTGLDGFNTGDDTGASNTPPPSSSLGGAGILMNSYAQFARGEYASTSDRIPDFKSGDIDDILSSSCFYAARHTLNPQGSVVSPSGMNLAEATRGNLISTGSLFEGLAAWDAAVQAGKKPFYDSYEKFASNIRLKGQGYSTIPEFRISSHVYAYQTKGVTEELLNIFELSGALRQNTTTETDNDFYQILNTSEFLKSFDLIEKDHKDFSKPSILTLRCKAIKKFLPYEGFYPAQRTTQIAQQFYSSYNDYARVFSVTGAVVNDTVNYSFQALNQPLFAPGVLFNTIKAGVACDYPIVFKQDNYGTSYFENEYEEGTVNRINTLITGSALASSASAFFDSIFSLRVPFEALVEPEVYLANQEILLNEPHPFGLSKRQISARWDGNGNRLYKKMANNFLAEVPEFFLKEQSFSSLSSLESSDPQFGNAESGSFYVMRVKMWRSRDQSNDLLDGLNDAHVNPPQDLYPRTGLRENFTMYSRPSAFGPPSWGGGSGSFERDSVTYTFSGSDSMHGYNFPYTPPYYNGEAWCDLIFEATETKKYSLEEILGKAKEYPYYTRFWWPGENDAFRDLVKVPEISSIYGSYSGPYENYASSPWRSLPQSIGSTITPSNNDWGNVASTTTRLLRQDGTYGPQHPSVLNYNAMQLNSSVNIFGKGIIKKTNLDTDGISERVEVLSDTTNDAKARWVIQTKFETPMLNFNKYNNLSENNCTMPAFARESVPRGMWHQYGEMPSENEGVYLQIEDIPDSWLNGALNVSKKKIKKKIKSLANLCGFSKNAVKLGEVGEVKQISEAVVAVPFVETNGKRNFFTIPDLDIDDTISALKREVEPNVFVAGGPPKVGNSVKEMVRKMQKYVFPPPMDFVKYREIQPFAMYIFEFTHNLTKQDLSDIWQNLPPSIGTSFEMSESSIAHELLAKELIGGGSQVQNGVLDDSAVGNDFPSKVKWMVFKVKQRARTDYFSKVINKTSKIKKSALEIAAENREDKSESFLGKDASISYNWPYDFFSLVELVKLDAEVTFSDMETDSKGANKIRQKKKNPDLKKEQAKANSVSEALGKKGAFRRQ